MVAFALVGLLLLASGCSEHYPQHRAEVLGTWEAHDEGHVVRLDLNGDGTLKMQDVPRAALSSHERAATLDWSDTVDVSGDWTFYEPSSTQFSTPEIRVWFDGTQKRGDLDGIALDPEADGLHLWYGDIDSGEGLLFRLVRTPSTPALARP
ncbi:MAG: hypothetical protein JST33_13180 [Actinobacteria bacterium]|nr:hypothetical protein [Actinomycetota bacterium]